MVEKKTEEVQVPHVYKGVAEILKSLSVEKNGTLPGNMGGKPYITAVDTAAETKRQFVANNLVFLPHEEVVKHETIIHKDRLNIAILITGTYTIFSTVDGSSVQVSGTGDGLATGTAVASNIASTNALKNALLRTFLITEQSVEDASKTEVSPTSPATRQSPAQAKVDKARATAKPAAGGDLQAKIQAYIGDDEAKRTNVNAIHTRLKGEGKTGATILEGIISELGI